MKRVIKFKLSDSGYGCYDGDNLVFDINKEDLQFDVKSFYTAFFADKQDYSDIEITNELSGDSNATRIYECINKLLEDTVLKINEALSEQETTKGSKKI